MARSVLAIQTIIPSGIIDPTFSAANADGHSIDNHDERACIYAKNGSAGSITVTIVTPMEAGGLGLADQPVVLAAGEEGIIGPWRRDLYNQPDGVVHVDFSGVTSLTVAALRLPDAS